MYMWIHTQSKVGIKCLPYCEGGSPLVSMDKYRQCRLQCGHRCQKEMQSLRSSALARSPKLIIYSYAANIMGL